MQSVQVASLRNRSVTTCRESRAQNDTWCLLSIRERNHSGKCLSVLPMKALHTTKVHGSGVLRIQPSSGAPIRGLFGALGAFALELVLQPTTMETEKSEARGRSSTSNREECQSQMPDIQNGSEWWTTAILPLGAVCQRLCRRNIFQIICVHLCSLACCKRSTSHLLPCLPTWSYTPRSSAESSIQPAEIRIIASSRRSASHPM